MHIIVIYILNQQMYIIIQVAHHISCDFCFNSSTQGLIEYSTFIDNYETMIESVASSNITVSLSNICDHDGIVI